MQRVETFGHGPLIDAPPVETATAAAAMAMQAQAASSASKLQRLVLVMPSYYPDVAGGAERQGAILAEALARQGVEITLLAPTLPGGGAASEATSFGRIRRFPLRSLPARGGRFLLSTLSWTVRVAAWLYRHRAEYQMIYVFHARLHVLGALVGSRLSGKPVFVKPGGGGIGSDFAALRAKKFLYGRIVAALVPRWTDGFVAVSREIARDLQLAGVETGRIHPISNGVRLPDPAAFARAQALRTGRRFLFSSRLVETKNIHVLIQAVALCAVEHDLELTVLGAGPALASLKAQTAALGLEDRVSFPGERADVYPELLAHDVFVSASVREGQSNALLEAIATGLIPVCVTASGVAELVVDGQTGFLLDEPEPVALAAAMRRVLALSPSDRRRMSNAVQALAAERLDIDHVAAQVRGVLSTARNA